VIKIGTTYEGRDILLLKISFPDAKLIKPGMWIEGGCHAREWISPSSIVYFIYRILTAYMYQTAEFGVLSSVDWYLLPVLNADGYAFTYATNGNRLWRKNRSKFGSSSYSPFYMMQCTGTDLNRNYDFNWGGANAAVDPCIETYRGPSALSENETQAATKFLLQNKDTIHGYLTVHSYRQVFLTRWSYTKNVHPAEFNYTLKVAQEAAQAISSKHGVSYTPGVAEEIMYAFAGGSGDWAREKAGIKHSYEVELRDTGALGFILPTSYIIPVGEEIWEAVTVIIHHMLDDYPAVQASDKPTFVAAPDNSVSLAVSNQSQNVVVQCGVVFILLIVAFFA